MYSKFSNLLFLLFRLLEDYFVDIKSVYSFFYGDFCNFYYCSPSYSFFFSKTTGKFSFSLIFGSDDLFFYSPMLPKVEVFSLIVFWSSFNQTSIPPFLSLQLCWWKLLYYSKAPSQGHPILKQRTGSSPTNLLARISFCLN